MSEQNGIKKNECVIIIVVKWAFIINEEELEIV